jgi:hypothetical protein
MKQPSERMAQELTDVMDLRTDTESARETQVQKMLWGAAAITVAFLSYSALRLYCLGQILGAETVACLGLLLMIPMFGILHLLGPIRKPELRTAEARGAFIFPEGQITKVHRQRERIAVRTVPHTGSVQNVQLACAGSDPTRR